MGRKTVTQSVGPWMSRAIVVGSVAVQQLRVTCCQAMHNVSNASRRSAAEQLQWLQLAVEQRKIPFRQAGSVLTHVK